MTRVAVLGARSMLGRALVDQLRVAGHPVLTIGRHGSDDIALDLSTSEIPDTGTLSADILFHCAASFAGNDDAGLAANLAVNTHGALAAGRLARQIGIRTIIHAGTMLSNPECDPSAPGSYGLTKAMGEDVLGFIMKRDKGRFVSLRFGQLYDTQGLCCRHQPWFGRIVAYASRGRDLRMPVSLGPRNFLHVRDAAAAMIRAANGNLAGIVPATHPQNLTQQEVAQLAYATFGKGGQLLDAPDKTPFRAMAIPRPDPALAKPDIDMAAGLAMIRDAATAHLFGPMDVT